MNKSILITLISLLLINSNSLYAETPNEYLTDYLNQFSAQPEKAMKLNPPKYNSLQQRVYDNSKFSKTDINNNNFIELKDNYRKKICKNGIPGSSCTSSLRLFSGFGYADDVSIFFEDEKIERSFETLKTSEWKKARTSVEPWSGDYWATYQIGVAARYYHPKWPRSSKYEDYKKFFEKYSEINLSNQEEINNLSPAEKYDLLVQDNKMSLTEYSKNDADYTFKRDGKIETWFGLCHGWAPAAFMLERPVYPVEINLDGNLQITFYPDDIKALATILWANATSENHMMGGRCNDKNPKKDENGRIISQDCFDMNPGAWHLAVLNQIGKYNSSFVIDATYDYEVWNQPVSSYSLSYFNPITNQVSNSPDNAIVDINNHTNDIFKKYRSNNTKYLVGVSMNLTYVSETTASHEKRNSPEDDSLRTVQYIYDLELNSDGEIIGGEWYQQAHPDFIWRPYNHAKAISVTDHEAKGNWEGNGLTPKQWSSPAAMASSYGQPLAKVVEGLIKRSRTE